MNGSDLIHAGDLQKRLKFLFSIANVRKEPDVMHGLRKAMRAVDEAERVKTPKGWWMADSSTFPGPGLSNYRCSYCTKMGGTWVSNIAFEDTFQYCPWCGAEMQGVMGNGEVAII